MSSDKLEREIEQGRQNIHTDGYLVSVGEVISMYERQEIDIHPEFQRFFRWNDEQKSKLIESILLGIPLPSLFVAQKKDGTWDVIDGLQRLSTIFQLLGILLDSDNKKVKPLTLSKTYYLPSLGGKSWSAKEKKNELSDSQKLLIKRSKLDVKIIKRESDAKTKYELFQRLNSGGSQLTAQELRNCMLVMVNPAFFEWLNKLSKHPSFIATTALSDTAIEERYDLDLIVRFLTLSKLDDSDLKNVGDINDFLDDQIIKLASNKKFDLKEEETNFKATFDLIHSAFSDDHDSAFRRYDSKAKKFKGGFVISGFEAIALGLGSNISKISNVRKKKIVKDIPEIVKSIWSDNSFKNNSGSGVRASTRIQITVPLGRKIFK